MGRTRRTPADLDNSCFSNKKRETAHRAPLEAIHCSPGEDAKTGEVRVLVLKRKALSKLQPGKAGAGQNFRCLRVETSRSAPHMRLRHGSPWRSSARCRQSAQPPERDNFWRRGRLPAPRVFGRT